MTPTLTTNRGTPRTLVCQPRPEPLGPALLALVLLLFLMPGCKTGRVGAVVNATMPILYGSRGLSEGTIVKGLKEALTLGTARAVDRVSRSGGYLRNPEIKIPLPQEIRRAEDLVRAAGFGRLADDFVASMNKAAEKAAPEAKEVFWQALRGMTFAEARSILQGEDDAATRYFEGKTRSALFRRFQPLVSQSMSTVGVTRTYQRLHDGLASLPVVQLQDFDLDGYVTGKALDGLFAMLAREEEAIRDDPAARTTELLKRVFGSR